MAFATKSPLWSRRFERCAPRRWETILLLFSIATFAPAQTAPETVGRIEGNDIAVKGPVHLVLENNQSTTVLSSGSEVTVRSGAARIALEAGGQIGICGPAHLTVLKSGGAITLALDYGRIHTRVESAVPLVIYTPIFVATPFALAGGPRETVVGLQPSGSMCLLAAAGAVRLEQQFTGESVVVPQSGEIFLSGGQLQTVREAPRGCRCEASAMRTQPATPPKLPEVSILAAANHVSPNPPAEKRDQEPPAKEEPVWKVVMPPLTFEAKSPAPPPAPSSETILLVREVHVRPAEVYRGRVEPRQDSSLASRVRPAVATAEDDAPIRNDEGIVTKIQTFLRRLAYRGGPCAGVGCGGSARLNR